MARHKMTAEQKAAAAKARAEVAGKLAKAREAYAEQKSTVEAILKSGMLALPEVWLSVSQETLEEIQAGMKGRDKRERQIAKLEKKQADLARKLAELRG